MFKIPPPERDDWADDAACAVFYAETGFDAWFGPDDAFLESVSVRDGWAARSESRKVALEICAGCPVRSDCLRAGLRQEYPDHRFGIWGGMTPAQRTVFMNKITAKAAA